MDQELKRLLDMQETFKRGLCAARIRLNEVRDEYEGAAGEVVAYRNSLAKVRREIEERKSTLCPSSTN